MRQRESMSNFQHPMCVMLSSIELEVEGSDNCFSHTAILGGDRYSDSQSDSVGTRRRTLASTKSANAWELFTGVLGLASKKNDTVYCFGFSVQWLLPKSFCFRKMLQKFFFSLLSHELQAPCGHSVHQPLTSSSGKLTGENIWMCVSDHGGRVWMLCPSYKSQYITLINLNLLTQGAYYKTVPVIPKARHCTDSDCFMTVVLIHFPSVEETIWISQLALSLHCVICPIDKTIGP